MCLVRDTDTDFDVIECDPQAIYPLAVVVIDQLPPLAWTCLDF